MSAISGIGFTSKANCKRLAADNGLPVNYFGKILIAIELYFDKMDFNLGITLMNVTYSLQQYFNSMVLFVEKFMGFRK